jgi:hypothetical protein
VRVNLTASPPLVCNQRVCSPRPTKGLPHVAHFGRSSSSRWLHSSVSPMCTTSWISCARNWFIRSSTAASISAHVACGCSLRHWVIPRTSRNPALTRLASLDCVPVCSSWLSCSRLSPGLFPLVYHLPPVCKKMNRTPTLCCHEDAADKASRTEPPNTLSCKIARFSPYYLHRTAECPSGACAILFRLPIWSHTRTLLPAHDLVDPQ